MPGGTLAPFRERPEHELADLAEEDLLGYIVATRGEGRIEAATAAAQILAWRHEEQVEAFVAGQLPDIPRDDRDEIAEQTLFGAIRYAAKFKGETLPEFRGIIFTIARRRIADYLRDHYKDGVRIRESSLDDESGAEKPRPELKVEDPAEDVVETTHRKAIFKRAYLELKEESHRMVIRLVKFEQLSHREAAEQVNRHLGDGLSDPMTEQNVNKINSRFDRRLEELRQEAEGDGT